MEAPRTPQELTDERARDHRRTNILLGCLCVCSICASLGAIGYVRQSQSTFERQERLVCVGNTTILHQLTTGLARLERSKKVDPPAKKAIDASGIATSESLIVGISPSTRFCAKNEPPPKRTGKARSK